MADETDITYVLKMRDEAVRVLMNFEKELKQTGVVSKDAADKLGDTSEAMDDVADSSDKAKGNIGGLVKTISGLVGSAAIFYGLKKAVTETLDEFAKYDSGQSDIRKTTGLSGSELDKMGGSLREISTQLATSTTDLQGFAATAGRAGITGSTEILKVTKSFAEMNLALDGIDTEAFLRFLGNTKDGVDNIDKVAAALNSLDDSSSTSAARITDMGTDIAAAGSSFKLASQDVLAWSALLAESGVNTGVAATTIQRLGVTIDKASAVGGQQLKSLAGIAGTTSEQFKKLATTDMAGAINSILKGLGDIKKENSATYYAALKEFQLDQVDSQTAISTLTAKYSRLQELRKTSFGDTANEAKWATEIKTQLEKYDSTRKAFEVAKENFYAAVGGQFAEVFGPLLKGAADLLVAMTEVFNTLPDGVQTFIVFGAAGTAAMVGIGLAAVSAAGSVGILQAAIARAQGAAAGAGILRLAGSFGMVGAAAVVVAGSLALYYSEMERLSAGLPVATKVTDELHDSTENLSKLLSDPSATQAAINQSVALVKQRQAQLVKTRENIVAELELRRVEAQKAASEFKTARTTNFGAGGGAGAGMATGLYASQQEGADRTVKAVEATLKKADSDVAAANKAVEAAKNWKPDAAPTIGGGGGAYVPGAGKKTGGAGGSQSKTDAQRDSEERAKDAANIRIETAAFADQIKALDLDYDARLRQMDVIQATSALRKQTGNETAQLSAAEIAALNKKTDAELAYQRASDSTDSIESMSRESAVLQDQLTILGYTVDKRREEAAVLDVIRKAKEQRRGSSEEERDAARQLARDQKAVSDAQNVDSSMQDYAADTDFARKSIQLIGADNLARRQNIAILQAQVSAKRQNRAATQEELDAAREAATAQYDLDQAQQAYADSQSYRMGQFDAVADSLRQFATGAKSARSAISDLAKSLVDLIIQYQILGPIRRAFESGGSQGSSGFLGKLIGLGTTIASGGTSSIAGADFTKGWEFDPTVSLTSMGGSGIPRLATGGNMQITGNPGVDQNLLSLNGRGIARVSHGETLNVGKGGSMPGGSGGVNFAPVVQVTVDGGGGGQDPTEMGKMVGDAVTVKMHAFVKQESRPGGVLYRLQRG